MTKRIFILVFAGIVFLVGGIFIFMFGYRAPQLHWTSVTPNKTRVVAGLDPAFIQELKGSSFSSVLLYGETALTGGVIKGDAVRGLDEVFDGMSNSQYIVWLAGAVPEGIASNGKSVMFFGCRYENNVWLGSFDLPASNGNTLEFECTKLAMQEIPSRYDWPPVLLRLLK